MAVIVIEVTFLDQLFYVEIRVNQILKIVAAVLVLYVYQGAVETEVPRIIVFLFLLFFTIYIDNKIFFYLSSG